MLNSDTCVTASGTSARHHETTGWRAGTVCSTHTARVEESSEASTIINSAGLMGFAPHGFPRSAAETPQHGFASGRQPRSEIVQHARSLRLHGFERNRVLISVLVLYGLEDWVVSIRAGSNFMEAAVTKNFHERFLIPHPTMAAISKQPPQRRRAHLFSETAPTHQTGRGIVRSVLKVNCGQPPEIGGYNSQNAIG
jgi:hypothetical protein